MYIPQLSDVLGRRSGILPGDRPLNTTSFTLDTSGMATFFGGDVAVTAMTTLHLDPTRRWLGWYNAPGTYEVAKRYGRVSKSRLLEGLFPGVPTDLVTMLGLAGIQGAKYIAAHSGTIFEETGPFAALLMEECQRMESEDIQGRETVSMHVTITELNHDPENNFVLNPTRIFPPIVATIPILVSAGTAVACAIFTDWFCFCMIVLGMLANGVSCLTIGAGRFVFQHPVRKDPGASGSGDGILLSDPNQEIIVLKGSPNAVDSIIRGAFQLRFASEPKYRDIKCSTALLVFQFIAQILLIPQGSLFGQILFVGSLIVSGAYNMWLASWDREATQREVCIRSVLQRPVFQRYKLGTRTSAAVFTILMLKPKDPAKFMDMIIPNDTPIWKKFKANVISRIRDDKELIFDSSFWEDSEVTEDRGLLELLYRDAEAAYRGYKTALSHPHNIKL
ncbi:hypothetical protein J3A83DRAFT_2773490 [Scleroderma citrinum]